MILCCTNAGTGLSETSKCLTSLRTAMLQIIEKIKAKPKNFDQKVEQWE